MAITNDQLVNALRLGDSDEELNLAMRLKGVGEALVEKRCPAAPDAIKAEAVIRIAGWLYDKPNYSIHKFSSILKNSGAGELLLPWVVVSATSTGD
ncbi:MAG: hypothetical protein OXL36_14325 [Bryobacterales bacterium]|nr:hypothetical protein [Bryobacterales bacterium]MDE0293699.1 hypothetical protein [Bryobacterales bacterium]